MPLQHISLHGSNFYSFGLKYSPRALTLYRTLAYKWLMMLLPWHLKHISQQAPKAQTCWFILHMTSNSTPGQKINVSLQP
jgi:hypothetical protein